MVLDGTDREWYSDQYASWHCHRQLPADQHKQLSRSHNPNRQYYAGTADAGRLPDWNRRPAQHGSQLSRRCDALLFYASISVQQRLCPSLQGELSSDTHFDGYAQQPVRPEEWQQYQQYYRYPDWPQRPTRHK